MGKKQLGQDASGNDVEGNWQGTVNVIANTQTRVAIRGLEASTQGLGETKQIRQIPSYQ